VGYYHFNIYKGIRDSAAKTLLGPIMHLAQQQSLAAVDQAEYNRNSKFKLLLQSTARRVIIEKHSSEYSKGEKRKTNHLV